jgi:hypothetical protein
MYGTISVDKFEDNAIYCKKIILDVYGRAVLEVQLL